MTKKRSPEDSPGLLEETHPEVWYRLENYIYPIVKEALWDLVEDSGGTTREDFRSMCIVLNGADMEEANELTNELKALTDLIKSELPREFRSYAGRLLAMFESWAVEE